MCKISLKTYKRISPDDLAGEFNKLFAASTTVQQLPGKGAGKEVLVQGTVAKNIADYLVDKYHIARKYIEIAEKKK